MRILKARRSILKASVTRIISFENSSKETASLGEWQSRLQRLDDIWREFMENTGALLEKADDDAVIAEIEQETGDFESRILGVQGKIRDHILRLGNSNITQCIGGNESSTDMTSILSNQTTILSSISRQINNPKAHFLPKLTIKPFSGELTEWKTFHDSFVSAIHENSCYTACQKLQFLKGYLVGQPYEIVEQIPETNENYSEAWSKLCTRYAKIGIIAKTHVAKFLQFSPVTTQSPVALRKLFDGADEVVRGLRALGTSAEHRDIWLIHILTSKLDSVTNHEWSKYPKSCKDFPTFAEFMTFFDDYCSVMESTTTTTYKSTAGSRITPVRAHKTTMEISGLHCLKCNDDHDLQRCSDFLELEVDARREFVASRRVCYNCLRAGHISSNCRSKYKCRNCQKTHHTLLHKNLAQHGENNNTNNYDEISSSHSVTVNLSHTIPDIATLLPTAVCKVYDSYGDLQQCRMLLDSGSEKTIVSEKLVERLGLKRNHSRVPISAIDNASAGISNGWVSLKVKSMTSNESFIIDALIMRTISSAMPAQNLQREVYSSYLDLDLADRKFYISSPVDMLLGNDKFFEILKGEKITGQSGKPHALLTAFGWVIGGDLAKSSNQTASTVLHTHIDIDRQLTKFWEVEEVPQKTLYTVEEIQAEESFSRSYTRADDGKFSVALPFKTTPTNFGDSLSVAKNRLFSLEKRFTFNKELKQQYTDFMEEYILLGHMHKIPDTEHDILTSECYYLPHHPVFKMDSTTTKIRVVFDGSSHNGNFPSLNETLLIGPSKLREIFDIVLRFRRHRFIISGDVEKMYRQIWVHNQHRDYQRIVWRSSTSQPVEHYRLNTVTYGTSCAPFLAVRVLDELAYQSAKTHPSASQVILKDFYMDDVMTGADTVEEVFKIHGELVGLLKTAGMNLRKWCSNCDELLKSLPDAECEMSSINFETSLPLKLLGLKWNPATDDFEFSVSFSTKKQITKQSILSDAARIFDPLGFLTPCTVTIKIFFQELWLTKLDWKDEIPDEIAARWMDLKRNFELLGKLKIPRRILVKAGRNILHGFCDASKSAYAAVVYCRSENDGIVSVRLVAAKSRVAPLKELKIPRLELCGAQLLCRLMNSVASALEIDRAESQMWTDSTIVLSWLSSLPRRWSVYVGNRTAEILESYNRSQWHYVRSSNNPADCATRGVMPATLEKLHMWWEGPQWLSEPVEQWSSAEPRLNFNAEELEERKPKKLLTSFHITIKDHAIFSALLSNVSNWSRFVRTTAYCLRFVKRKSGVEAFLTASELQQAENYIIHTVQLEAFGNEINDLIANKNVSKRSKLSSLMPFLDTDGLLRVGGRIEKSLAPFAVKHPIILPGHAITTLIVTYYHLKYLHVGVSELFFILRQRFWILGVRNIARRVVHACVTCFKLRRQTISQLMSDLPLERVTYQRPFSRVGCDYAGPFFLKTQSGRVARKIKGYIALFVCFITKAIHIELVGDLTTDSFIGALDRFISRRGKPVEIWTDNATNFVGAKRKLSEMSQILTEQHKTSAIASHLAQDGIAWRFIPPASPHFGGLWESGVKSVKTHLKRVIGESSLPYEQFYTLLTRIEALLNSRPLCPSNDGEIDALTPSHFLIGQPYTARPEPTINASTNIDPLRLWDKVKHMAQGFWNRWHSEYLTSLQQRQKWRVAKPYIKLNDVVVLREPNMPQSKWVLGKIVKLHTGQDEKIRVVTVKTSTGEYIRPITKIAPLPFSVGPESSSGGENVLD